MAGVDVGQMAFPVEHGAEQRDEAVRRRTQDQRFVQAVDDFGQWQIAGELKNNTGVTQEQILDLATT